MPKLIDLTGKRLGRLLVLGRNRDKPNGPVMWDCVCDCGTHVTRDAKWIRYPGVASCGCYTKEVLMRVTRTHGMTKTAEYKVWLSMKSRCQTPSSAAYYKYGGRGIAVCDRWQSFENFLADMGEKPSPQHTIDRIDGTKGYSPDNCRWALPKEQQRNLKNNVFLEFNGKSLIAADWEPIVGIDAKTIQCRVQRLGWTAEEALTLPRFSRPQR